MDGIKGVENRRVDDQIIYSDRNVKTSDIVQQRNKEKVDPEFAANIFKENLEKLKVIFNAEAEFKIDKETGMIIVKIKEKDTGEIIRQIPPEVALKLAKNIEELLGMVFDEHV